MATPSTVIRVDQDVVKHLAKHVRGFESPNDVLRRLLRMPTKVDQKSGPKPKRRR